MSYAYIIEHTLLQLELTREDFVRILAYTVEFYGNVPTLAKCHEVTNRSVVHQLAAIHFKRQ